MLVREFTLKPVEVPLAKPYVYGRGTTGSFKSIIIQAHTADGAIGVGESTLFGVWGNMSKAVESARQLATTLVGIDSFDFEELHRRAGTNLVSDLTIVSGFDLAMWDLNGRHLDQPVSTLLGGTAGAALRVDYTLSAAPPIEMARRAADVVSNYSYRGVCVKVGTEPDVDTDVERVREVRAALGPDVAVRADANEGFDLTRAIEFAKRVSGYDVELLEQPLPRADVEGLAELRRRSDMRISADEGLCTLQDAADLAAAGLVDIFNIKIPKCGGIYLARKIAAVADAFGLATICGGALALEVGRQACRQFTAGTSVGAGSLCHEGPAPASQELVGNVTDRIYDYDALRRDGGLVRSSTGAGLDVTLVPATVEQFAWRSEIS